MAVLVEAISAVIRVEAIHDRYPGGWDAFAAQVPNRTLCSDDELARVGFMTPVDCKDFMERLGSLGLDYFSNDEVHDAVVVDQLRGFAVKCVWAECGRIEIKRGRKVSAARLKGSTGTQLFTPEGWTFEGSLSESYAFVPSGEEDKSMPFLRHENGLDVFFNVLTGKEAYIGRTIGKSIYTRS